MVDRKRRTKDELTEWLDGAERVVLVGIGNPIRMDDFVGVKIVQDLKGKVSEKVFLIECETVPESFVQQILEFRPTHILIIDTAILSLKPGESRLAATEELANFPAFSTHMLPLRLFCEHLSKMSKAEIALLLIQPENVDFGEGLSAILYASSQNIVRKLRRLLP